MRGGLRGTGVRVLEGAGNHQPRHRAHGRRACRTGCTAEVNAGLALYQTTGSQKSYTEYHGFLAEIHLRAGRFAEARNHIEIAIATCEKTNDRAHEAELHRLVGEVAFRATGDANAAEEAFQKCLEVARRQGARSWELRGAMSLARLWHHVGRTSEARDLLAGVFGQFTEGFATPDLRDARELLEELNSTVPA